jgi:hypothetical protein
MLATSSIFGRILPINPVRKCIQAPGTGQSSNRVSIERNSGTILSDLCAGSGNGGALNPLAVNTSISLASERPVPEFRRYDPNDP